MKTDKYFKIVVLILLTYINTSSFEKVGTTSFQFLKVITTARAASMAGAYSSIAGGSDAVFWNPAGLTSVENIDLTVGYADWFLDIMHYSFSAAYTMKGVGTFALQGMMTNVGEIEETTVGNLGFVNGIYNPGLTGNTFSPKAMVIGISYARDINDRFTFGLTAKYAHEDLVYKSTGALIFDGGLKYKTGFKSVVIAATLRHFGPEIKYIDRSFPLPQTLNIGISTYLFSSDDPLLAHTNDHSLLVSYDMIQPRDYEQQHNVGLEYGFSDLIYLRGGYVLNSDQEGLSAGAGFRFRGYSLDYSFNDYGEYLDSVHRVSLSFSIN
ncbi:MAG: PorV/PorQ family protein [Melioribacteraceae bacterium]|nr:PorV/PorQ family protein [Melioribacteraceae bacterium]